MPRGSQPGERRGGRQKGTPNKRTTVLDAAVQEAAAAVEASIPDAFKGGAHAFLMGVYKNPEQDLHTRLAAAKAALPCETPFLSRIEARGELDVRYVARVPDKAPDAKTWQQQHAPSKR